MQYPYSSLGSYLGQWRTDWLKKEFIISRFSTVIKGLSYRDFLQNTVNNDNDKAMKHLLLE